MSRPFVLSGKPPALTSGATDVLKRILKKNGLDYPSDYKLLAVGGGSFNHATDVKHLRSQRNFTLLSAAPSRLAPRLHAVVSFFGP